MKVRIERCPAGNCYYEVNEKGGWKHFTGLPPKEKKEAPTPPASDTPKGR